jgi:hypothetical protein
MPGTSTEPVWSLLVAGSPYSLLEPGLRLSELVVFSRDGASRLTWQRVPGAWPARSGDPFRGKTIELRYDEGSGDVVAFYGRCVSSSWGFTPLGWARSYTALGRQYLADLAPVTNTNTGDDAFDWNSDPDDTLSYRGDRAGRSVGRILLDVLTDPANAAAMQAAGVGDYNSTGTGGTGSATLDGLGVAGGGGTGATATATVSSGSIISFTVTSGGSGYTSPPEVWIAPCAMTTLGDLAAMRVVPPFPVSIGGDRLAQSIAGSLRQIAPNHAQFIGADGSLRYLDQRQFGSNAGGYPATITLTADGAGDRFDVDAHSMGDDTEAGFSQVRVRGPDFAELKLYSTRAETLEPYWAHSGLTLAEAEAAWKLSDYEQPDLATGLASATCALSGGGIGTTFTITRAGFGYTAAPTILFAGGGGTGAAATATISGGKVTAITRTAAGSGYTSAPSMVFTHPDGGTGDGGTCSCTDTLNVLVNSDDNSKTWAANYWDQTSGGRQAVLWLWKDLGSGAESSVQRRIVANTTLAAGGTSTITVDRALPNLLYDRYAIRGVGRAGSIVHRRYRVVNEVLRGRLRPRAAYPSPVVNANGNAATTTSYAVFEILWSSNDDPDDQPPPYLTWSMGATIDWVNGTLDIEKPVVTVWGTRANLLLGGASTDGIPWDVRAYIPTRTDVLEAYAPRDGSNNPIHGGTINTLDGISRTLTVTVPSWRDPANLANMRAYADDLLDSVKDVVFEGSITLKRFDSRWFAPGRAVQWTGSGYTTSWESAGLPVVECALRWTQAGHRYETVIRYSNRRAPYSAALYERPARVPSWFGGALGGAG